MLQDIPPLILAHNSMRGIIHAGQVALKFTFMLAEIWRFRSALRTWKYAGYSASQWTTLINAEVQGFFANDNNVCGAAVQKGVIPTPQSAVLIFQYIHLPSPS
ncbi:hypothetical protein QCA50_020031 [Cerrena zonata]|uniref:Uncharacterized protein n=1 Tax=Cerrena zonata TaxID=2478898 RepID=A0AAW0FB45_9APHY